MRALLACTFALGACAPAVSQVPPELAATASEQGTATLAVVGDRDGAVVLLSVADYSAVALDAERPARLLIGGAIVEAVMQDAPSTRHVGGQTVTGASYRVGAETARALARGGPVNVELSIGGTYQRFRASRADVLE